MKFLASFLVISACACAQIQQEPLFPAVKLSHGTIDSNARTPGVLELSSLVLDRFTTISHPSFPGRSARIKRSNFCDGGVAAYTGYIDVGPKHFFFYFFESRNDPDTDDVLLWTNGGPGGSSATGLFMELGPCSIESSNSTKLNPYSWNTNANIFFIDQPIGTGFSYHDVGDIVATTEEAGQDIAAFIATFFETFHKFKGRAFHLTGESYAGRYLPIFGAAVFDQNPFLAANGLAPINLKSIMIGNGATDFFSLLHSYYDMQCTTMLVPLFSDSFCSHTTSISSLQKNQAVQAGIQKHNTAFKRKLSVFLGEIQGGIPLFRFVTRCHGQGIHKTSLTDTSEFQIAKLRQLPANTFVTPSHHTGPPLELQYTEAQRMAEKNSENFHVCMNSTHVIKVKELCMLSFFLMKQSCRTLPEPLF